jgi:hypothetical protein
MFNLNQAFPFKNGLCSFIIFVVILIITYLFIYGYYDNLKSINLKINNTNLEIKFGDIFNEKDAVKVIPFNEYFDTDVDPEKGIISKNTLNGKFIEQNFDNNSADLDHMISEVLKNQKYEVNSNRQHGKKNKYKLGTIAKVNDYFLTALTNFDNNNSAYIEIDDYISFLITFWHEIHKCYEGNIAIPILGDGRTRFKINGKDIYITSQKLIELIIEIYELTNLNFDSRIVICIYNPKNDINLLNFK